MADVLTPDICVIGGGPAGIAAARAAAASGVGVVLAEKRTMGGANVTGGAIPLAAMMAAASLNEVLRRGPSMGVTGAPLQVNWSKLRAHVASAAAAVAAAVSPERLALEGIRVISGRARFLNPNAVSAGETVVRARRFILAVGGRPALPDLPGIGNVEHMTPSDAFEFGRRPSHLIVLGATAEGLALAQAHQRLGIDVTVIDQGPLLPGDDPELTATLAACLRREGVRIRIGVSVERVTRRRAGVRLVLREGRNGETIVDGSQLLLAAGRKPAADGLGLDAAGVAYDNGGIVVRRFRTTNRRVYAIGDAIAGAASVVRAEWEGRAVVQAILYRVPPNRHQEPLPRAVATDPALASVGMDEVAARKAHRKVRVWRYPVVENELALTERLPEGVLKLVSTADGRILGASMLARDAAEHVALWSLAIGNRLTLRSLAGLVAAYPSLADVARVLSRIATGPRLTPLWRKRIIRLFGKFG